MRIRYGDSDDHDTASGPTQGAGDSAATREAPPRDPNPFILTGLPVSTDPVREAIETMSRRIADLARELNCLGHFDDDDDDRPRAA